MKIVTVLVLMFAPLIIAKHDMNEEKALKTLEKYGYIDRNSPLLSALVNRDALPNALREYQQNMGLNITGELDAGTRDMMQGPRCGNWDNTRLSKTKRRHKRYALFGINWNKKRLSYRERSTTSDLPASTTQRIFREAFQKWSDVTDLDFERKRFSGNEDIRILFASGNHGDDHPFDGKSGTLAHASPPSDRDGSDAHFDEDEMWTDKSYRGINLLQVATHELGHTLGLLHSNDRNAVMFAKYGSYKRDFHLGSDDIAGIQRLYGQRSMPTNSPSPTPSFTSPRYLPSSSILTTLFHGNTDPRTRSSVPRYSPTTSPALPAVTIPTLPAQPGLPGPTPPVQPGIADRDRFCAWNSFDAISMIQGTTYAFKNDLYVVLDTNGIAPGYPRYITEDFPDTPINIDAVMYHARLDQTFIFKGSYYWRYSSVGTTFRLNTNYPRLISTGFPGVPNDVDFAMVWGGNGLLYFFKGNTCYRFARPRRGIRYLPLAANIWKGLPFGINGITAAFQYENGRTYFFSPGSYYRLDDRLPEVDMNAVPAYPRPISKWWLKCSASMHNLQMENTEQFMEDITGSQKRLSESFESEPDMSASVGPQIRSTLLIFMSMYVMWAL